MSLRHTSDENMKGDSKLLINETTLDFVFALQILLKIIIKSPLSGGNLLIPVWSHMTCDFPS